MASRPAESSRPEDGQGSARVSGDRPLARPSEAPSWAQFAEPNGDAGDLSEFEDLVDSLKEAVRMANGERPHAAASRPSLQRSEAPQVEAEQPAREANGEADTEYPEWLTGTRRFDEEAAAPGLSDEMKRWFGMPSQPQVYLSYQSYRVSPNVLRCWVTIRSNGHEMVGMADGPSLPGVRAEIAAKATLDALSAAESGSIDLSLVAARVLRFADLPLAVVSVHPADDEAINPLVGAYIVEGSEEKAAIMATLRATDRWITGVIGGNGADDAGSVLTSQEISTSREEGI